MKMAVVCANGKAGKWIVKEAMARGLDVTAVVRGENRTEAKRALVKDLYDLTAEDLKGFDVVVDAFGAWTLVELRKRDDVKWTYLSPAADFQADGERTGKYLLGGEELTLNERGESVISYADYAIAMVDEAMSGNHIRQRISVVRA